MKVIYIILLLFSIVANDLVFYKVLSWDSNISMYDNPIESQSEKESNDSIEHDIKIKYSTSFNTKVYLTDKQGDDLPLFSSFPGLTPYLEVHSPPPE